MRAGKVKGAMETGRGCGGAEEKQKTEVGSRATGYGGSDGFCLGR